MYNSLDDVKKRFEELGIKDTFGVKKEMKALTSLLDPDEEILYANTGMIDVNTNLMVCTSKRVLLIDKGMLFGIKSTEILFPDIVHISYKKGLMFGEISMQTVGGTTIKVEQAMKAYTEPMVKVIKEQMEKFKNVPNQVEETNSSLDVTEEIRKYKGLLDDGIITEEEFNNKKAELLNL